jgi:hypothetical protein
MEYNNEINHGIPVIELYSFSVIYAIINHCVMKSNIDVFFKETHLPNIFEVVINA